MTSRMTYIHDLHQGEPPISSHPDPRLLARLIESAPRFLDLTDECHLQQVQDTAEVLLSACQTRASLEELESRLAAEKEAVPLLVHLAVKLARSKQIVDAIDKPVHVSLIFAVYKEQDRIRTKEEHEYGENFLLRKISQLEWLFGENPNFTWDLTVVDDGDPEKTGDIALEILEANYSGNNVKVLFLEDAIREGLPVTRPMVSTQESQKGGSIAYGLWDAAQQGKPNHIVVFTDADLSTHLGQTGLLIDGIVNQGKAAVIGSRREEASIVVKKGVRNLRGKLFIYLWKRLIPNLNYVVDTQCGFKAFTADTVRGIVEDLIEKKFAFDIELLLKTELRNPDSILKVPIAWIDSEALSTTTQLQPYLGMLQSIAQMYHKYLAPNPESEAFAEFIETLDETGWNRLIENIPVAIAEADPVTFGDLNEVQVADFRVVIG